MAGCQTNRAISFHKLGVLDVQGPKEIRVSKIKSPAKPNNVFVHVAPAKSNADWD